MNFGLSYKGRVAFNSKPTKSKNLEAGLSLIEQPVTDLLKEVPMPPWMRPVKIILGSGSGKGIQVTDFWTPQMKKSVLKSYFPSKSGSKVGPIFNAFKRKALDEKLNKAWQRHIDPFRSSSESCRYSDKLPPLRVSRNILIGEEATTKVIETRPQDLFCLNLVAPAFTTGLHLLTIFILVLNIESMRDYTDPLFTWFWYSSHRSLFLLTMTIYLYLSFKDPGFVSHEKQETSMQNPSYRNTTDPTANEMSVKEQGKKPLRVIDPNQTADPNYMSAQLSSRHSKEETLKNTETFKYYEFSDPPPVNLHTEEDSHVISDDQKGLEGQQGDAGSQTNGKEDATHFHLSKSDLPVQPSRLDSDRDKEELDTSEVREVHVIEDVQDVSFDPLPVPVPEQCHFEDVDLANNIISVEVRYCVVCKVEQPMRAKHCKECGECVALHDHHCPWLGVCIGERTRCYFYAYLTCECTLLWTTLSLVTVLYRRSPVSKAGITLGNGWKAMAFYSLAHF